MAREDVVHLAGDQHLDGKNVVVNTGNSEGSEILTVEAARIAKAHKAMLLPTEHLPLPKSLRGTGKGYRKGKNYTAKEELSHPRLRTGGVPEEERKKLGAKVDSIRKASGNY